MALTVGELNGIITIDDRAVNPALRRAENAMRDTGQHMGDDAERAGEEAGQRLGDGLADSGEAGADRATGRMSGALGKLKTAALGVGVAAGAVLMDAFGQAMEQGQITGKLQAQLGTTPAVAKRYGQIAGALFKDAIVADFQEGADTINAISSAGLFKPNATNAQIKSLATNAADLANTFDIDLTLAANAAGSMLKNGMAKDGKQAFDLLAAGMTGLGPASDDLMETFTEYGPVFKAAGLSGETALGLIRQAIQGGWSKDTDKIADAFKEFGIRATDASTGSVAAFKMLGLNAKQTGDDVAAGGKRGEKAMDSVLDRLRKLGPNSQEAKQVISALFGGPGEDLGAALFALDVDKASKSMGGAKDAANGLGDGLRDNAATKVTAFKNTLQQDLVEFLGSSVIPKLSTFFGFVQQHSGLFKAMAVGVTALGVAFSIAAIGVWAMNSAMLANPMFWIIAGIAVGVAGLVMLIVTYWDDIKSATMTAWQWVVDKVQWAIDGVLAAAGRIAALPGMVARWWLEMQTRTVAIALRWVAWVAGLPGRISGALAAMAGYLAARGAAAFTALRNAAATRAVAMIAWVRGLPGKISGAIGAVTGLLVDKGRNIVQGLWSGIQSMGGWIKSQLISWAKQVIPGPIAKALGINSPSKVTREQGRWIARGLIEGLTGSTKQVKAASMRLSDIIADSLAPGKKRSKALGKLGAGTKQLLTLAKREETLAARMKTSTKKLDDLRKARIKLAADVTKGVLDSANITQQTGSEGNSAESILDGLRANTAAAQRFAADLAKLRKKGVRGDLIAQIAQAGVQQGSSAAAALATANAGQIKAINSQQKALVIAAGKAGDTAGSAMYGAGINAAKGLVQGLRSQQKNIERQMLAIARGMSKSIRAALGIKSPSKVMATVGAYTAQGVIEGVESQKSAVNRSMASLVDTPAPGSWGMSGAAGSGRRGQQKIELVVKGSSREDDVLVGMIRRRVSVTGAGNVQEYLGSTGRRSSPL